ncbi:hypothetical protein [Actinotalea sp. Marseille-Q4924]|uniref:hypothetical protein n=1 Tax=Actinotalea sp. Marseille-Q4924 TaxID=2866571 RepID=UPI001CE4A8B5|nr:hypothetical protein [Actinotalea sp. Marseille-Q4924]
MRDAATPEPPPPAVPPTPDPRPAVVRPRVACTAAAVLTGLLGWFLLELQRATPTDGALTGLSERIVAGAQSLWPLVVVAALTAARRRRGVDPMSR